MGIKAFKYNGKLYHLNEVDFSNNLTGYRMKAGRVTLLGVNSNLENRCKSVVLHRLIKNKGLNSINKFI